MRVKLLVEFMKLVISYKNAVDQTDKVLNLLSLAIRASDYDPVPGLDDVDLDVFEDN